MDALYPQALVATPFSTAWLAIVLCIQALSICFTGFAVYQLRKMIARHAAFFVEIGDTNQYQHIKNQLITGLWVYVFMTIIITIFTTVIFVFQPHIL